MNTKNRLFKTTRYRLNAKPFDGIMGGQIIPLRFVQTKHIAHCFAMRICPANKMLILVSAGSHPSDLGTRHLTTIA